MYWFRMIDFGLLAMILISLGWAGGGWLITRTVFKLRPGERLLGGISLGWLLFLTLANLLAPLTGLPFGYAAAAAIILAGGVAASWRSFRVRPWPGWSELSSWPQLAALAGFTLVFALIGRSLALFDDYLHVPLVSRMAAGDIPPHFYLNDKLNFAYHYGLQVFAAFLAQVGRMFVWSAWDLSKAFAIALTLVVGWLWARRMVPKAGLAGLASLLITFGGGARWLLLLLPVGLINWLGQGISLINSGLDTAASFPAALSQPWLIEGGGPMPFPFAYHNGVFAPVISVLGSTGAMPFVTVLLLLLITPSGRISWPGKIILGLVIASLALSAEHLFAFLCLGIALAGAGRLLSTHLHRQKPDWRLALDWLAILLIAGILSLFQGGFITEVVRSVITTWQGEPSTTSNFYGFSMRWPPAVYSAHLGILSLFDPRQVLVLLAEMGPILLLAPLASLVAWRWLRRGSWLYGGLGMTALLSLLFPLFVRYGVDRSITRLPGTALWLWLVLALPGLALWVKRPRRFSQGLLGTGYFVTVFGGVIMFGVMLASAPAPQSTYFLNGQDARFSQRYWGKLDQQTAVLDRLPERAVAVFGLPTYAHDSIYVPLADWDELLNHPIPDQVLSAGYRYIYMDDEWWAMLPAEVKESLEQPCVKYVGEPIEDIKSARWLLDLNDCR